MSETWDTLRKSVALGPGVQPFSSPITHETWPAPHQAEHILQAINYHGRWPPPHWALSLPIGILLNYNALLIKGDLTPDCWVSWVRTNHKTGYHNVSFSPLPPRFPLWLCVSVCVCANFKSFPCISEQMRSSASFHLSEKWIVQREHYQMSCWRSQWICHWVWLLPEWI